MGILVVRKGGSVCGPRCPSPVFPVLFLLGALGFVIPLSLEIKRDCVTGFGQRVVSGGGACYLRGEHSHSSGVALQCVLSSCLIIRSNTVPVEVQHQAIAWGTAAPESGWDLQWPLRQQEQTLCCLKPLSFGAVMAAEPTYSD